MTYLGADHRGFALKEYLKKKLKDQGLEVTDLGADHLDSNDDYVVFAQKVGEAVIKDQENKGVVICGSGAGVDMVANKIDGVRCALVFDKARAVQAREHEDANIIALPADTLKEDEAWEIVEAFLNTPFSGEERHVRRLAEMKKVEESY